MFKQSMVFSNCRYDTGQPQSRSSPQSISASPVRVMLLNPHSPIPPEQNTPSPDLALLHAQQICVSMFAQIKRVLDLTAYYVVPTFGADGHRA